MSKKVFVSYKYKDKDVYPLLHREVTESTDFCYTPRHYVDELMDLIGIDNIYKGEKGDEDASHLAHSTIDSNLKRKLFDSSVTIVLLSPNMVDPYMQEKDQWIPNEIVYSLRNDSRRRSDGSVRTSGTNAIIAVALPDSNNTYQHAFIRTACGARSWRTNDFFNVIGKNMFNKKSDNGNYCSSCGGYHYHHNEHSYVYPMTWEEFVSDHNSHIEHALGLKEREHEFELKKSHD